MNKKGQLALFVTFFIFASIIVLIASVAAPLATKFTTQSIIAGEKILQSTQDDIADISDPEIKASVNSTLNKAMDAAQDNITITSAAYKYIWVLVVGLGSLIIYLITRSLVEVPKQGFV